MHVMVHILGDHLNLIVLQVTMLSSLMNFVSWDGQTVIKQGVYH